MPKKKLSELFEGENSSLRKTFNKVIAQLSYCKNCIQVTNHYDITCLKCGLADSQPKKERCVEHDEEGCTNCPTTQPKRSPTVSTGVAEANTKMAEIIFNKSQPKEEKKSKCCNAKLTVGLMQDGATFDNYFCDKCKQPSGLSLGGKIDEMISVLIGVIQNNPKEVENEAGYWKKEFSSLLLSEKQAVLTELEEKLESLKGKWAKASNFVDEKTTEIVNEIYDKACDDFLTLITLITNKK